MRNPQLNADGELIHLLTLEGLPAEIITRVLDTAVPFGERLWAAPIGCLFGTTPLPYARA